MSNAKSRLRLIEPVRMFDEQRVNTMGNCQHIRWYCLYSSARPYIQSLTHEETKKKEGGKREREREGERGRGGGRRSAKSVGVSAEVHGTRGCGRLPRIDLTS